MTRIYWKLTLAIVLICPAILRADEPKPVAKPAPKAIDGAPTPDAKKEKGRLPPYYAKLVDETQREAIYKIEGEYAPKMKDLYAQLKSLNDEREQKIRAVLTADQQKKLDDMIAAAKTTRKHGPDKAETKPANPDPTKPGAKPDGVVPAKPAVAPVLTK